MSICGVCWRKKRADESSFQESKLARILTTVDLIALGVGSTLGVGIYVLAGEVSKTTAGPAVVLSFLLAAITSVFAGLCFAEFGARVPKAGSAYAYSYYCVGELVAFVIGWNLLLEYVIGAASVARGISTYIDSMVDNKIKLSFIEWAPIYADFLSDYVDFFAFGLCIFWSAALAFGVKESTIVNNLFTTCNVGVVLFVIISGFFKADVGNWQIPEDKLPPEAGTGGFAPFGIVGIIKGAAICFYGFVGFDCIATTGEEVKNPQRAIPVAILTSLSIVFLAYFGVSTVLTLMWPYYLQDEDAPIPHVYEMIGWYGAKWAVAIGALFGLFSSLFGAMFPLPRIVYAMANDGLIFKCLGTVHPKYQTPLLGTLCAGLVTACMAAFFDLQQLISMMALGTLLAYTIVAICVLVLRYIPDNREEEDFHEVGENTSLVTRKKRITARELLFGYFNTKWLDAPTTLSGSVVTLNIILYTLLSLSLGLVFANLDEEIAAGEAGPISAVAIFAALMLIVLISTATQPKSQRSLPFKMPFVPLLPCLSIFINIYLMVVLDGLTWIRFAIWMAVGLIPYLSWYLWRVFHNETGKHSTYEINRLNAVKLNDSIWKIMESKKKFNHEIDNLGFVEETTDANSAVTSSRNTVEIREVPLPDGEVLNYARETSFRYEDDQAFEISRRSMETIYVIEDDRKLDRISGRLGVIDLGLKEEDTTTGRVNLDNLVNASYGFLSDMNDESGFVEEKEMYEIEDVTAEVAMEEEEFEDLEDLEDLEEVEIPAPDYDDDPEPVPLKIRTSLLGKSFLEQISKTNEKQDKKIEIIRPVQRTLELPAEEKKEAKLDVDEIELRGNVEKMKRVFSDEIPSPEPPLKHTEPIVERKSEIAQNYLTSITIKEKPEVPPKPPIPPRLNFENKPIKPVVRANSRLTRQYLESITKQPEEEKTVVANIPKPPPLPDLTFKPSPIAELIKQINNPPTLRKVETRESAKKPQVTFREKLSNILQEQIRWQNYTSHPISPAKSENFDEEDVERYDTYKTIKTLSRSAMKNRLEDVLTRGPPNRASLRNSFELDLKRKETVNALREIESKAGRIITDSEMEEIKAEPETTDVLANRQKLLMGNVLNTIKLKNRLKSGEYFQDDFD